MSIWTRLTLLALAALLFTGGARLADWDRARKLEQELLATRDELERLHIDHRDTLDAITSAMDAREAINEQARKREQILQEVLDDNAGISSLLLPDDLRLCLIWAEDGDCVLAAPGNPAQGHPDSGQEKPADGR